MGKPIEALIIDDERYSREELKHLLEQHESIRVTGEADSGENGLMRMIELAPDVIFVDIEMPKMTGMELVHFAKKLKKVPLIVFATAYPNFAAEAFRFEAVDYLLKPFDEEQLKETVSRIEQRLSSDEAETGGASGKLAVEGEKEIVYLPPHEIVYISRAEGQTNIVTKEQVFQSNFPLKELEQRLKGYPFFRIHKSYMVNLDYVKKLIPWFNGAYNIELHGRKEQLSVSRNYAKELRNRLEL